MSTDPDEGWREVGRIRLPVSVTVLSKMAKALDNSYGPTFMSQDGEFLVFSIKTEARPEPPAPVPP